KFTKILFINHTNKPIKKRNQKHAEVRGINSATPTRKNHFLNIIGQPPYLRVSLDRAVLLTQKNKKTDFTG
ncbi:MAG: hypothetical protein NTY48_04945, partial [Candidatus Diapherotrites archaeon]|nr:hypothetical protein [Candidatus Diapherotrites archaeon]